MIDAVLASRHSVGCHPALFVFFAGILIASLQLGIQIGQDLKPIASDVTGFGVLWAAAGLTMAVHIGGVLSGFWAASGVTWWTALVLLVSLSIRQVIA